MRLLALPPRAARSVVVAEHADDRLPPSVVIARTSGVTARVLRSNVLVMVPGGDTTTLSGLQARVWLAAESPCRLGELTQRIQRTPRTGDPWAAVINRRRGHDAGGPRTGSAEVHPEPPVPVEVTIGQVEAQVIGLIVAGLLEATTA